MTARSTHHYLEMVNTGTPILDVRAPVEFASGHLPTSCNLPLLNDEERHQVGLIYRQRGQHAAIELGEKLVSGATRETRIAAWGAFVKHHPDAVVCCFRGGLRSQTTQRWLLECCDIDLPVVTGGYKAIRQFLLQQIEHICSQQRFVLVGGYTGSGKTHMLERINRSIDLEGLAHHRGSAFGNLPEGQPSQASFDNALASALIAAHQFASGSSLVLEHESAMIGHIALPKSLRTAMDASPIAVVEQSLVDRVMQIRNDYIADLLASCNALSEDEDSAFKLFRDHLTTSALKIRKRLGEERHSRLMTQLCDALDHQENTGAMHAHDSWIHLVLTEYYDPMYAHQLRINQERIVYQGTPSAVVDWLNQ